MKHMPKVGTNPVRARWRRIAWGFGTACALLVVAAMIFRGALARMFIAHSVLRDVPLRFESATVSPLGSITLWNVEIEDSGEFAGQKLLTAASVRMEFSWSHADLSQLQSITFDNVEAYLRPGADGVPTLMRLLKPRSHGAESRVDVSGATAYLPFSFGQLLITGTLHIDGYPAWERKLQLASKTPIPVSLLVRNAAVAGPTERGISLVIGDPESPGSPVPTVTGRVRLHEDVSHAFIVNIDTLTVLGLSQAQLAAMLEDRIQWPSYLRRAYVGRLERLQVTGSARIESQPFVSLNVELRDLSLRTTDDGPDKPTRVMDRVSASAHVEGRWTDAPWKDLAFSRIHGSAEGLQIGDWRLGRTTADVQVELPEIAVSDAQAAFGDAQLVASGAFDTSSHAITRARVWLNNASASRILARLPADIAQAIPLSIDGTVSARLFLTDSDVEHLTTRIELSCPDQLMLIPGIPSQPMLSHMFPRSVALSNVVAGASFTWNRHFDAAPEIARGRVTADEVDVAAPRLPSDEPLPLTRLKADFSMSRGQFRLEDCYANLPYGAQLSTSAIYIPRSGTLEHASLNLDDVDAAFISPWLPPQLSIQGQFDFDMEASASSSAVNVDAALGVSQESTWRIGEGNIVMTGVSGAALPSVFLNASFDRRSHHVAVASAGVHGIGLLRADGAMMRTLRGVRWPQAASGGEASRILSAILDRLRSGSGVSLEDLSATGDIDTARPIPLFKGSLAVTGLATGSSVNAQNPAGTERTSWREALEVPLSMESARNGTTTNP
jgi:hypothetical protein